ncbi:MAG: hypothetical protein K6E33_07855, partial [Lachnospiraceae bacterium]|nr:hypothetical protein [Lachnospiraceae bacterium]
TEKGAFAKWSDAAAFIDGLNNKNGNYLVVVDDDVNIREDLKVPSKAGSLTLSGNGVSGEPVYLTFTGDLKLKSNTAFINMALRSETYNKKDKTYSLNEKAKISIGNYMLIFDNTEFENKCKAVSGGGKSSLVLEWEEGLKSRVTGETRGTLSADGAISAGNLSVDNYDLKSVGNGISVKGDTYLTSAELDAKKNIVMKNLHSLDENNKLKYAESQGNSLKVTGTVDSISPSGSSWWGDATVSVKGADGAGTATAKISKNAVSISVKYGDTASAVKNLVNGAKVPASYFVVGRESDNITIPLKKVKKGLLPDKDYADKYPVELYLRKQKIDGFKVDYENCILGYYQTLQDALTDVDMYKDKENMYYIAVDNTKASEDTITNISKNLKMPKYAELLTICSVSGTAKLNMNNQLKLGCDTVLEKIGFTDNGDKKLNINLGQHFLEIKDPVVSEKRIGNIAAAGAKAEANLNIQSSGEPIYIKVNGKAAKFNSMALQNVNLTVDGNYESIYVGLKNNSTLSVVGNAKVQELTITGGSVFSGDKKMDIVSVYNDDSSDSSDSTISCNRLNKGKKNESSGLSISGTLDNKNQKIVIDTGISESEISNYLVESESDAGLKSKMLLELKGDNADCTQIEIKPAAPSGYSVKKIGTGVYYCK